MAPLIFLALLLAVTKANILSIDDLKLIPFYFDYRYRYVYSDFTPESNQTDFVREIMSPLADAYITLDMKFTPLNTNEPCRAFVFFAKSELLEVLILDLESKRVNNQLRSAGDIEAAFRDYSHALTILDSVDIIGNATATISTKE